MSMVKQGVCDGEGDEPIAGGITRDLLKEAIALGTPGPLGPVGHRSACAGHPVGPCGSDALSKMSDAVKEKSKAS